VRHVKESVEAVLMATRAASNAA